MVTRRVSPHTFSRLFETIFSDPARDAGAPYQSVSLKIDERVYSLDLHLDHASAVTILQAYCTHYDKGCGCFSRTLITQNGVLLALLEILLYHCAAR